MQKEKSSQTSLISAFARAYHARNNEHKIFDDYLAASLLTNEEYAQISEYLKNGIGFFAGEMASEIEEEEIVKWVVQTQLAPTPLARAGYCEKVLHNEIRIGCRQFVILGAGMDTFAFRNEELLKRLDVFELDHPNTQNFKSERIKEAGWEISDRLHFVPIDFQKDNLPERLVECGYDKTKKTFFSWLGVSYYLSERDIHKVLSSLSEISSEGSAVVFDYADEGLFNSEVKRVKNMLAMAGAAGEHMKVSFSYKQLEKTLEENGFLIYEHLTPDEIEERFFKDRTDYFKAFEHINYVLAVRK